MLAGVVDVSGPVDRTALWWHVLVWDLWFLVWGVLLVWPPGTTGGGQLHRRGRSSRFLDRYAEALTGGDLPGIAACYALPALVVGEATIPVAEPGQLGIQVVIDHQPGGMTRRRAA